MDAEFVPGIKPHTTRGRRGKGRFTNLKKRIKEILNIPLDKSIEAIISRVAFRPPRPPTYEVLLNLQSNPPRAFIFVQRVTKEKRCICWRYELLETNLRLHEQASLFFTQKINVHLRKLALFLSCIIS